MSPGEEARRVRARTQDTSAGEAMPGLSPRGTPLGESVAESPRRSQVSAGQLQQWLSPTRLPSPGPSAATETLPALSVEGRNALIVHAAERAMRETGMLNEGEAKRYRSTFAQFADGLLQMRPPVGMESFLERLNSPDPATREAAARMSAAYENGRTNRNKTRTELAACFRALSMVPAERRMLTLGEMLQRKAVARVLKTLLPAADHGLLQQVQAAERPSHSRAALEKQTMLIRLGVALRAQGHGGLSGWVQLHRQPEGPRLANELFEQIKNGPELQLSRLNKRILDEAVAMLRACNGNLGQAGPSAAAAPARAAAAPAQADALDEPPLCDPGTPTAADLAFLGPVRDTGLLPPGTVASHDDLLQDFGTSP
jgi:hypothetical protein